MRLVLGRGPPGREQREREFPRRNGAIQGRRRRPSLCEAALQGEAEPIGSLRLAPAAPPHLIASAAAQAPRASANPRSRRSLSGDLSLAPFGALSRFLSPLFRRLLPPDCTSRWRPIPTSRIVGGGVSRIRSVRSACFRSCDGEVFV